MICASCQASVPQDIKFCPACGASLEGTPSAEETSATSTTLEATASAMETSPSTSSKPPMNKQTIIGLCVGSFFILIGLIFVFLSVSLPLYSFGADFYTEIYRIVYLLGNILLMIKTVLGWILVAIGAAINLFSLRRS